MLQVLWVGMHTAALCVSLQATTISEFLFIFLYFLYTKIIIIDAVMEKYILFWDIPIFWKQEARTCS